MQDNRTVRTSSATDRKVSGTGSSPSEQDMPKNMLIHDGNLEGRAPSGIAQNTYEVPSGHVPTDHIIGWAAAYARSQQGLDDLIIMCHGYESGIADPDTQSSRYVLGYGLALGEPGLTLSNLGMVSMLKGFVNRVVLLACGPANTQKRYEGTNGDGKRFCGGFALISGATVIAATQTQYYVHPTTVMDWLMTRPGAIKFGAWEGPVLSFNPVDGSSRQIDDPPTY